MVCPFCILNMVCPFCVLNMVCPFCVLNMVCPFCVLNGMSLLRSKYGISFLHSKYGMSCLRSKYGINFQSHNLAHCNKVATTVEQLDSQSKCHIEQLRILLRTRCNEYVINGFTHEEITVLTRQIACHELYYCYLFVFYRINIIFFILLL